MISTNYMIKLLNLLLVLSVLYLILGCNGAITEPEHPILTSTVTVTAEDSYTRIDFQAVVTDVYDPDSLLGGTVNVNDLAGGSYLYDSSCTDSRNHKRIGEYLFDQPPFEFTLVIGDLNFRSDPSLVDIMITVKDQVHKQGLHDSYEIASFNNLEVLPGVGVSLMVLLYEDADGTAIYSDALFTSEPDPLVWTKSHHLTITGSAGWAITAKIGSTTTPEGEEAAENRDKSKDKIKLQ